MSSLSKQSGIDTGDSSESQLKHLYALVVDQQMEIDALKEELAQSRRRELSLNTFLVSMTEAYIRTSIDANKDHLTGMLNRKGLSNEVASMDQPRTSEESSLCAFFLLDIDFFKQVNDNFGHDVGDEVIQELADRIRGTLRKSDVVEHHETAQSRMGGDEFAIVAYNCDGKSANIIKQKLQKAVVDFFESKGHKLDVGISVGYHVFDRQEVSPETFDKDVYRPADQRLYQDKLRSKEARRRDRMAERALNITG